MRTAIPIVAFAVALAALAARGALAQEGQGTQAMPAVKAADTSLSADERAAPAAQPDQRGAAPAVHPDHPRAAPAKVPAPKRKPPLRRRSVQQIIATVPPPPLAGPSYGPTLYVRPPGPVAAPAPGITPVYPPPPAALGTCQGSACTDTAGGTYTGGVGNALINSQGRLCSRNGQTVQCF